MPTTIDSPYGRIDVDERVVVEPGCAIRNCTGTSVVLYSLDADTMIQLCGRHAWVLRLDVPRRVQPDTI